MDNKMAAHLVTSSGLPVEGLSVTAVDEPKSELITTATVVSVQRV
jgi:hypothetical protein